MLAVNKAGTAWATGTAVLYAPPAACTVIFVALCPAISYGTIALI